MAPWIHTKENNIFISQQCYLWQKFLFNVNYEIIAFEQFEWVLLLVVKIYPEI